MLQKLDHSCLLLNNQSSEVDDNFKDKVPTGSFLTNWRLKYLQKDSSSNYLIGSILKLWYSSNIYKYTNTVYSQI